MGKGGGRGSMIIEIIFTKVKTVELFQIYSLFKLSKLV